jgi:pantothenate kinase-related protein Tda10
MIEIIVRGPQGVGKTAIATVVCNALVERRFEGVTLLDDEAIKPSSRGSDEILVRTEQAIKVL